LHLKEIKLESVVWINLGEDKVKRFQASEGIAPHFLFLALNEGKW
jgi:hypothetical protein